MISTENTHTNPENEDEMQRYISFANDISCEINIYQIHYISYSYREKGKASEKRVRSLSQTHLQTPATTSRALLSLSVLCRFYRLIFNCFGRHRQSGWMNEQTNEWQRGLCEWLPRKTNKSLSSQNCRITHKIYSNLLQVRCWVVSYFSRKRTSIKSHSLSLSLLLWIYRNTLELLNFIPTFRGQCQQYLDENVSLLSVHFDCFHQFCVVKNAFPILLLYITPFNLL